MTSDGVESFTKSAKSNQNKRALTDVTSSLPTTKKVKTSKANLIPKGISTPDPLSLTKVVESAAFRQRKSQNIQELPPLAPKVSGGSIAVTSSSVPTKITSTSTTSTSTKMQQGGDDASKTLEASIKANADAAAEAAIKADACKNKYDASNGESTKLSDSEKRAQQCRDRK